jgi:hypothetical protein
MPEVLYEPALGFEFRDIRAALRAPRVAIVIDDDDIWRDRAALALFSAAQVWGGAGFIVVPGSTACSPAMRRLVSVYDPDYVVGMGYTLAELVKLGVEKPMPKREDDLAEYEAARAETRICAVTPSDAVAAACTPYSQDRIDPAHRGAHTIGTAEANRPFVRLDRFIDLHPSPAVPGGSG